MNVNTNFDFYGNVDVTGFIEIINTNKFDWDEWDFRTKRFPMLKQTKTVPILFDESWELKHIQKHKHFHLFEDEMKKLENHFVKNVFECEGHILNALLVKLEKGHSIKPHVDSLLQFHREIFTRLHIPIYTNDKCIFTVGGESKNLKVGEIWDPNYTMKVHDVRNDGETDRIHLIVDWVKNPQHVSGV